MPAPVVAAAASNCFGCAPKNPIGLQLVFERSGDRCAARVTLGNNYESFPGIVHGGIVAAIMDETMAQAVYRSGRTAAFTAGLRVRYGRPMETDIEHLTYAEVTGRDDSSARVSGRIERPGGDLVAAADATFYLLSDRPPRRPGPRSGAEVRQALLTARGPTGQS